MARNSTDPYVREFSTTTDGSAGGRTREKPGRGPLPPLPRQRRRRMAVLGILLIGLGAVAAAYLAVGLSDRQVVVMVTRNVPIGTQLSNADVTTTRVAADTAVAMIPGRQLNQVVGKIAAVDLRRGTLLAASQLTAVRSPGPGQQVVPVAIKLAQLPARGLQPGDQVLVIATPGQSGQDKSGGGTGSLNQETSASVDQVSSPDPDGNVRVDLVVDAKVGPALAKQAATGQIGFVLTPRVTR